MRALRQRATHLDPSAYAFGEAASALELDVAAPLRALIAEAIALLTELEELYGAPTREAAVAQFDWDAAFEMTPVIGDGSRLSLPHPIEVNLAQSAADLCYTARSELRRIKRHLDAPQRSHEELLLACERGRRKLRRCLAVVLEATNRIDGDDDLDALDQSTELEAAIAIRRMYAKFRRSLLPCHTDDPDSVRRAIRYAAVSLAVMIGSTDFADVRLSDRLMLSALQARMVAWARGASTADGVRLFKDIEAAAELLRAISLREELQTHDRALLREARAQIGTCTDDQLRLLLGRLRALQGLDDDLDELLRRAMNGAPVAALRAELDGAVHRLIRETPATPPPGW